MVFLLELGPKKKKFCPGRGGACIPGGWVCKCALVHACVCLWEYVWAHWIILTSSKLLRSLWRGSLRRRQSSWQARNSTVSWKRTQTCWFNCFPSNWKGMFWFFYRVYFVLCWQYFCDSTWINLTSLRKQLNNFRFQIENGGSQEWVGHHQESLREHWVHLQVGHWGVRLCHGSGKGWEGGVSPAGVELRPFFTKILAWTTFVHFSNPGAKNPSLDAILEGFPSWSGETRILQSIWLSLWLEIETIKNWEMKNQ